MEVKGFALPITGGHLLVGLRLLCCPCEIPFPPLRCPGRRPGPQSGREITQGSLHRHHLATRPVPEDSHCHNVMSSPPATGVQRVDCLGAWTAAARWPAHARLEAIRRFSHCSLRSRVSAGHGVAEADGNRTRLGALAPTPVLKACRRSHCPQACDQRLCLRTPSQNVQRLVRPVRLEDLSGGLEDLSGITSSISTFPARGRDTRRGKPRSFPHFVAPHRASMV